MASRWEFKLEGTDNLTVEDEGTSPDFGPLGKKYRFGRAVAEAAGWPPEPSDHTPTVEVIS